MNMEESNFTTDTVYVVVYHNGHADDGHELGNVYGIHADAVSAAEDRNGAESEWSDYHIVPRTNPHSYNQGRIDAMKALLRETWTTQTASDILIAAYDSYKIPSALVDEARDDIQEVYGDK